MIDAVSVPGRVVMLSVPLFRDARPLRAIAVRPESYAGMRGSVLDWGAAAIGLERRPAGSGARS